FRRHRVCRASCEFLDSIADSAVLNVEESNPALYMYIPELEEALRLRQQLNSLRGYLATCRQEDSLQLLTKSVRRAVQSITMSVHQRKETAPNVFVFTGEDRLYVVTSDYQ
ncbi:Pleckstrin homology domain-containing family M member 3, partial [Geodia barretti]